MRSFENKNSENDHETMTFRTIMGFAQRLYDYIIAVSETSVLSTAKLIYKFPAAYTQNGGGFIYSILKIMVKRNIGYVKNLDQLNKIHNTRNGPY